MMIISDLSQMKDIKRGTDLFSSDERIREYEIIEYFLTRVIVRPYLSTTAGFYDEVKQKQTDYCNSVFCSGTFWWEGKDIYHFVNYNMPLSQEFIDYVLDQYKQGKFTIKK